MLHAARAKLLAGETEQRQRRVGNLLHRVRRNDLYALHAYRASAVCCVLAVVAAGRGGVADLAKDIVAA